VRVLKKALRVCWIANNSSVEIKVYELLAIQYFYMQDLTKGRQFQDRATRGKLEGVNSSSRKVGVLQGIKSDDEVPKKQKLVVIGAYQQRTNTTKVSDAIVRDYGPVKELIESLSYELYNKTSTKQMVENVTN
jgi:hypothetical protein